MIRILDLFAGTQSVRKAIGEMFKSNDGEFQAGAINKEYGDKHILHKNGKPIVQYIGVDIYSPENPNLILDLAQDNVVEKLKDKLPKGGKPDFIGASPVCNKLSASTTGPNGNSYFIVDKNNKEIKQRVDYSIVKHNGMNKRPEMGKKYFDEATIALRLHNNTKKIIDYFNVPFAIENPATALSRYIYKDYKRNVCHYSAYGFEYKKPTAIYTNKQIELKKGLKNIGQRIIKFDRINKSNNGPSHGNKNISIYANRSSVPPKLIQSIIKQLKESDHESK